MTYSNDLLDELNILLQFNLEMTQEGIKIHRSAGSATVGATTRLFNKGLITQADGGYLTDLGHIAAKHAQAGYAILRPTRESSLKPAAM
ncbi:MAG: TIGR02647 family protein [Thiotrichaceae bacterium]|nr:TIGR02647 family protein [Thiotrichaceae bacterium]